MKINQLFTKKVEVGTLLKVLQCFGLNGLMDRKMFSKSDMVAEKTVERLKSLKTELSEYYLPCKAKVYLDDMNEKKAITVFKQLLRLYGYNLLSKEKNLNGKKVIYYKLCNTSDTENSQAMFKVSVKNVIYFD